MTVTTTGFDHDVAWREFQTRESRPRGESEDAFVKADKHISYDYAGSGNNWRVTEVRGTVNVNQIESWVVEGQKTEKLLEHEQGHFDITALGMREEAQRTSEITGTSGRNIDRQYEQLKREINRKIAAANSRYDTRTDHSRNEAVQRRWLQSIQSAKASGTGTIDDLPT